MNLPFCYWVGMKILSVLGILRLVDPEVRYKIASIQFSIKCTLLIGCILTKIYYHSNYF